MRTPISLLPLIVTSMLASCGDLPNADPLSIDIASGVSDAIGTVPRYGEAVLAIPVTISAFDMARQIIGFANAESSGEQVAYRVRGKLEGGWFGTRRFRYEGTFALPAQR